MTGMDEFSFWVAFGDNVLMYHIPCRQASPEEFDFLDQAMDWAMNHLKECDDSQ